jgi:pimeloyl-ACP methyl ester carboxylesterase
MDDRMLATTSAYASEAGYRAMMRWYAATLASATVPYESITVATRFGDTHLLAAGPTGAPPVVFLHGMEGSGLSWKPQVRELAASFRTYAVDIIGSCGRSAPVRLSLTNGEYAEWLTDVVDALELERASYVGISNGAWVVMKLAAHAPERIAKAILMSANGLVPVRFPFTLARHMETRPVRATLDFLAGHLLTRGMVRLATGLVRAKGATPDPDELEWFYVLAKYYRTRFPPGPVTDDELRTLAAPTLLMMGERERFYNAGAAIARAARLMPDLRAGWIVPGVGHNMATDNPRLINARIAQFLMHTR